MVLHSQAHDISKPYYQVMAILLRKLSRSLCSFSSQHILENSVKNAIDAKSYQQIADLITTSNETFNTSNPFSFLSKYPHNHRTKIIDEILQSFIPLRPRYRPQIAYSCLLSFTLQTSNPLPLSLAILQRTLRSGCIPHPQTHLLLSNTWLHHRKQNQTVSCILLQMHSIGYQPDNGICNYLISSLCKVDQHDEAVQMLRSMKMAGCIPDNDSFGSVIGPLCVVKRTKCVQELMKEMVAKYRLTPRHEIVVKVLKAMRAKKDIFRAAEVIKFLEEMGVSIGFESYEMVVEMCLESGEFVLAGKVAVGMTNKGFIPYIKVRLKVLQGLADTDEFEFASTLQKKFTELKC